MEITYLGSANNFGAFLTEKCIWKYASDSPKILIIINLFMDFDLII